MVRSNRSQSRLSIRPQAPSPRTATTPPTTANFVPTHRDRCPNSSRTSPLPHQHLPSKGSKSPSIEEYRNASSATRQQWTESQRRRIAENEALLRQLAEIKPEEDRLSIKTHLPRGNDLTVEEQIVILHESVTPGQYAISRDMLLDRPCEEISNNIHSISPISSARSAGAQNKAASQPSNHEWSNFPELDTKYNPPPSQIASPPLPQHPTDTPHHPHPMHRTPPHVHPSQPRRLSSTRSSTASLERAMGVLGSAVADLGCVGEGGVGEEEQLG